MAEDKKELNLKVAEAMQDDVNKGIVRIDSSLMKQINVFPGDIVEIEGEKKTVGIADRALPGDLGLTIIRMDGLLRRNAKTGIGESVKVRKAEVTEAKKIVLAPARKGIRIEIRPLDLVKKNLLGRAVVKGDVISLGGTRTRREAMTGSPFFDDVFPSELAGAFGMGLGGLGDIKLIVAETNPKGAVVISESSEIEVNSEAVELKEEEAVPDVSYEDIGGLEEEIKKIREMVELPLKHPEVFERLGVEAPKGVLLHGPPGTGKTLLAKAVANESNSSFFLINGPEIMSKFYGQSEENLRKKFEEAEKEAPSIIFIDEIDAIAPKREESKGEVERRVVAQLLTLMDGLKSRGRVVVIAATNIPNEIDPALRRPGRFDRELELNAPNEKGRLNILKIHTRNMPVGDGKIIFEQKEKERLLKDIAQITYGFVGADLASLSKEAAMIVLRKVLPDLHLDVKKDNKTGEIPKEVLEKMIITKKDFIEALKVVRPSGLREVLIEKPTTTWEDVGGMDNVKVELKEAVELPLKSPQVFTKLGIRPPKGILLYGPPGTGKTLLAKAVANESKANFILIKGPELLSKWVGESEKAVRKIFQKARQSSPTIIFFDEIDSLIPKRGASADSEVTERVVNQILTELDGLEEMHDVVVIGATNRPDMLDTALLRPGRFDRLILTPSPDEKTRENIFKIHTEKMPIEKVDLNKLAKNTDGYSGADIESICREAGMFALRRDIKTKEITQNDFDEALKKVRPSITKDIDEVYKQFAEIYSRATGKEMKKDQPVYFG